MFVCLFVFSFYKLVICHCGNSLLIFFSSTSLRIDCLQSSIYLRSPRSYAHSTSKQGTISQRYYSQHPMFSMFKNAFSMSAVTATSWPINLNRMSSCKGFSEGPRCKQSLKLGPNTLDRGVVYNSHLSCISVKSHNSPVWKIVNISKLWDLVLCY